MTEKKAKPEEKTAEEQEGFQYQVHGYEAGKKRWEIYKRYSGDHDYCMEVVIDNDWEHGHDSMKRLFKELRKLQKKHPRNFGFVLLSPVDEEE